MFYETDLHTDRLSANRQRETAWSYRLDEFAPAELVPGFALHQTDRDVSRAEARVPCAAGVGRCAAASRRRDFDLLGYRYSLLAAVGTPLPRHPLAQDTPLPRPISLPCCLAPTALPYCTALLHALPCETRHTTRRPPHEAAPSPLGSWLSPLSPR